MKTIVMTIFEGIEAKNILRTPILATLLQHPEVRVVLVTKDKEHEGYYKREFSHERLIIASVEVKKPAGLDKLFDTLRFYLLHTKTTTLRAKMLSELKFGGIIHFYLKTFIHWLLARRAIRSFVRWLDEVFVYTGEFNTFFYNFKPDIVLSAQLFESAEVHLLREAKKQKVRTVGFVNSWDRVTARSAIRIIPDSFVVFNGIVKKELMQYHDVPEGNIFVSGIPQYDQFFRPEVLLNVARVSGQEAPVPCSRELFMKKNGLNPNRRFILYAPMGTGYSASDWQVIDLLTGLIRDKKFGENMELFVRFPPNDFVDTEEIAKRPELHFCSPGFRFSRKRGTDWDMSYQDLVSLTETLQYCELVICYASSISIDAALFDRPIINLNFELIETMMIKSPTRFYGMAHYKRALETGAIRLTNTPMELVEWVRRYLENPTLDRRGRERLVNEQCAYTDGMASERIGAFLLSRL